MGFTVYMFRPDAQLAIAMTLFMLVESNKYKHDISYALK